MIPFLFACTMIFIPLVIQIFKFPVENERDVHSCLVMMVWNRAMKDEEVITVYMYIYIYICVVVVIMTGCLTTLS